MRKIVLFLLFAVLLGMLITYPKYLKDLKNGRSKLSMLNSTIIKTEIGPTEYVRTGKGVPMLISHGITGGYDQGLGLAKLYIGHAYDLISVSRFGYLETPLSENASPESQADAYKQLLDALNIDKVFVFGNSAGGTSAIKFALKYPEKCHGLILVSSNVPNEKPMPPKPIMKMVFGSNYIYWLTVNILGEKMLPMAGVTEDLLARLSREEKSVLIDDVLMGGFPITNRTEGVINDMFLSNPDINNNYPFDQLKVPVLMFQAEDDPLCSFEGAKAMSEVIPNIEFKSYENGGHIIIGHDGEIRETIASFIEKTIKN